MAGAEFNINPFGRVAGGQEGSGQAQILEPFDATKYDRWAKEQGVKQEQAKALKPQLVKPIKPETIDEGRGEVKIKRDDVVDSINQGYTQFVLDEVIPLYDMRNSLVQAGVDIDKKYTNLDPNNVDDYNEKTKQRNAEWTELNGEIRKFKTQVAMSETAGKYIDNIAKIIADDSNNKLDLETTNRNKEYWLGKPVSEMIDYYQNNPIAVYKSKFDYLKFADSMSSLIDQNWRTNTGGVSPIEKDATSGMWVWNTSKGSSIDTVKFKNEIANTFRSTIANDPDAYNFMLSYKDKGAEKTYQQLAYEDNVSTSDKYAFADWIVDKKPEFIDAMIGAPEGWSTRTAIREGGGGGGTNVVVNLQGGTPTTTTGSTTTATGIFGLANATTLSPKDINTTKNIAVPSPDFVLQDGNTIAGNQYTLTANTSYTPFVAPYIINLNSLSFVTRTAIEKIGIQEGQPIMEEYANKLYALAEGYPEILNSMKVGAFAMANAEKGTAEGQGYWKINNMPIIADNVRQQYSNNAVAVSPKWNNAYKPSKYPKVANTSSGYTNALTLASQFPDRDFNIMLQSLENQLSQGKSVQEAYNFIYNLYSGVTP